MEGESPCPRCGVIAWRGEPPRCARCGEPALLDAVAADERLPELSDPLDPAVERLANSHRVARRTPAQRLVYALVANTLDDARRQDRFTFLVAYLFGPILFVVGLGVALGFLALTHALLVLGERFSTTSLHFILYGTPVFVLLFARVVKADAEKPKVELKVLDGRVIGVRLGRLQEVFSSGAAGSPPLFLGCAFGLMWGLLYFTQDHGGAPIAGGFVECFWLTLDNLCHGVFLDVCELYDLRFGPRVQHTFQSATVFNLFRLSFDALVVLFLYETWQRWRLHRLFDDFPHDVRDIDAMLTWIGRACADRNRLPTRYLDEVLFLVLAKEYLHDRYELVRQMSAQFPQLPVTPGVRSLFLAPDGKEVVFQGEYNPE